MQVRSSHRNRTLEATTSPAAGRRLRVRCFLKPLLRSVCTPICTHVAHQPVSWPTFCIRKEEGGDEQKFWLQCVSGAKLLGTDVPFHVRLTGDTDLRPVGTPANSDLSRPAGLWAHLGRLADGSNHPRGPLHNMSWHIFCCLRVHSPAQLRRAAGRLLLLWRRRCACHPRRRREVHHPLPSLRHKLRLPLSSSWIFEWSNSTHYMHSRCCAQLNEAEIPEQSTDLLPVSGTPSRS